MSVKRRRAVLFGTPIAFAIVSVLHPVPFGPSIVDALQPVLALWIGVHVAMLVLVALLGLSIWFLTQGISGRPAEVSRLAVFPFLTFYAAFDSIVGIATGLLIWQTQGLTGQELLTARVIIQQFWDSRIQFGFPVPGLVILIADASWIVAAIAAAFALRGAGASRATFGLMILSGVFFGIDHPFPTGTVGMICLLAAVILLDRQRMLR